jgi:ribosomal protein L11 methyltransferase
VELADTARIVPPWLRGTGDPSAPPEIVIDPGMAFGTGTHPTTQLALTLGIETLRHLPAASVLDVGTGSAILAIAALKHGAQRVTTTDLDPDVAPNVVDNLRLNSLLPEGEPVFEPESAYELLHHHPAFRLHIGPLTDSPLGPGLHHLGTPWDGPFDLVFCNMLQHEFTPLLPQFPACLRPGGKVILSGFLAQDLEELLQDLTPAGLEPAGPCMIHGDWGGLAVQARPTP